MRADRARESARGGACEEEFSRRRDDLSESVEDSGRRTRRSSRTDASTVGDREGIMVADVERASRAPGEGGDDGGWQTAHHHGSRDQRSEEKRGSRKSQDDGSRKEHGDGKWRDGESGPRAKLFLVDSQAERVVRGDDQLVVSLSPVLDESDIDRRFQFYEVFVHLCIVLNPRRLFLCCHHFID